MPLPLIPIAIGGGALLGGAGTFWLTRRQRTPPQTQQVTKYFDQRIFNETQQNATQYFFKPVENANINQTTETRLKQQARSGEVAQRQDEGILTNNTLNMILIGGGVLGAVYLITQNKKKRR